MTLEFDCISCDEHFKLDKGEGGIVIVVWKDGSKFYACSMACAAEARDDESKGPSPEKGFPFRGFGDRPGKGYGRDKKQKGKGSGPPDFVKKRKDDGRS